MGLNLPIPDMLYHARKNILFALFLSAAITLAGCGATTSSSILDTEIGKKFSVTGQWSGTITDTEYGTHTIEATLNSSGGAVTGTIIVPTHDCLGVEATATLGGEWGMEVTGDLVQAEKESDGDNILTSEQENSNSGTVELQTIELEEKTTDEEGEEVTFKRQIKFSLNGNSDVLSGQFSGTWIGPGLYCRSGLQGTIIISRR
jgi:hypothetical protein